MELTTCPDCGLPAEIMDRFSLYSTDGPIEHVKVYCVKQHWFVVPMERLAAATPLSPMSRPRTSQT
jgi:hypothetical protein